MTCTQIQTWIPMKLEALEFIAIIMVFTGIVTDALISKIAKFGLPPFGGEAFSFSCKSQPIRYWAVVSFFLAAVVATIWLFLGRLPVYCH